MTENSDGRRGADKETIHSGHFMVSHFEAEAQDDEDDLAVAVPEEEQAPPKLTRISVTTNGSNLRNVFDGNVNEIEKVQEQQLSIETSLTKLFRCMTLAYRQKLTSPKWNRFKGIKLRWKDKIRLNNVIWRCWHMQFIKKRNTFVCQFASPLDVDTHIKPEATLLEGKYWKRRAEAIIAEYKKWRMFHMRASGRIATAAAVLSEMDMVEGFSQDDYSSGHMLVDEDYIEFMSDTLFSTITSNQPFAFPDTREIARGAGLADFIQPSLGPLQPNLDDFMDTLEPLQELLSSARLPPVPEETDDMYRTNSAQNSSYNAQQYLDNYQMTVNVLPTQYSIQSEESMTNANSNHNMIVKEQPHSPIYSGGQLVQGNTYMTSQQQQNVYAATQRNSYINQNQLTRQDQVIQMQFPGQNNLIVQQSSPESLQIHPIRKPMQYPSGGKMYQQSQTYQQIQPGVTVQNQAVTVETDRYSNLQQRPQLVVQQSSPSYNRGRPSRARTTPFISQSQNQSQVVHNQTPTIVQFGSTYLSPLEGALPTTNTSANQSAAVKSASPVINVALSNSEAPQRGRVKHFKVPSPPLPMHVHQVTSSQGLSKESFRSNSLPLGTQINQLTQEWNIPLQSQAPVQIQPQKSRTRSRSSGGGSSNPKTFPPPLCTVLSEPSLPWDSVLLAHLLTNSQQSHSLNRLNTASVGSSSEDIHDIPTPSPSTSVATPSPPSGLNPRSPLSPASPLALSNSASGSSAPRDTRRVGHIHAEQKRRYNIKNGFDTLQSLIPQLSNNPNAKVSKAAMLQKGADYIKQLKTERNQIKDEIDGLRQQIECLNNSISNCQSLLPATGAPVSGTGGTGGGGARAARLRASFSEHVRQRTAHDHRYWVFSVLIEPLLSSYAGAVAGAASGGGVRDMRRATLLWLERHCSLVDMRPAVLNALLTLCTKTDILSNPEKLREEALRAIDKKSTNVKSESL